MEKKRKTKPKSTDKSTDNCMRVCVEIECREELTKRAALTKFEQCISHASHASTKQWTRLL